MSRWSWYEPAPKQPVPEDGLQANSFGETWWGEKWIRSLNRLGRSYSNRLPRGRSYARAGRVVNLAIGAGEATAGVVGTRRKPYSVRIELKVFSKKVWRDVVEVLAGRARYSVALLRGELPPEIGEALGDQGIELFPTSGRDIKTSCSCPDWANPCKHVAAVHYVVAAALDSDPFLIFALRGLSRQALLGALAEVRGMTASSIEPRETQPTLESLWEEPDEMNERTYLGEDRPPPQLAFRVAPAAVDLAGLARLGPPPPAIQDLPKRLGPGIRAAARAALALASRIDGLDEHEATDKDEAVRERVVDFIRGRSEGATMLLLRSRLPDEKKVLHRVVHGMRKEGVLKSTGWGAATKYTLTQRSTVRKTRQTEVRPTRGRKNAATRRERVTRAAQAVGAQQTPQAQALLTERITAVLRAADEPLPLREIAQRMKCPVDSRLRKAIAKLRSDGAVAMVGKRRGARYTVGDSR